MPSVPHVLVVAVPFVAATAAPSTGGYEWVSWLETAGAIGSLALFLFGFHREWWVTGEVYRRRVAEAEKYREALDAHRDRIEQETVPLLARSTDALARVVDLLPRRTTLDSGE